MTERQLLTPLEAAAKLGVGRTTMFRLIAERKIPVVVVGARRRIPAAALDRWIDDQAKSSTAAREE